MCQVPNSDYRDDGQSQSKVACCERKDSTPHLSQFRLENHVEGQERMKVFRESRSHVMVIGGSPCVREPISKGQGQVCASCLGWSGPSGLATPLGHSARSFCLCWTADLLLAPTEWFLPLQLSSQSAVTCCPQYSAGLWLAHGLSSPHNLRVLSCCHFACKKKVRETKKQDRNPEDLILKA